MGRGPTHAGLSQQILHSSHRQAGQIGELLSGGRSFDHSTSACTSDSGIPGYAGRIELGEVVAGPVGRNIVDTIAVTPLASITVGGGLERRQVLLVRSPAGEQRLACPPIGAGIAARPVGAVGAVWPPSAMRYPCCSSTAMRSSS